MIFAMIQVSKINKKPTNLWEVYGLLFTLLKAFVVGVWGFEPQASWSRTKRDTKLRHTPKRTIESIEN